MPSTTPSSPRAPRSATPPTTSTPARGSSRSPGTRESSPSRGALAVTVLAGRTLGVGVVTGLGSGLTGGELVGNRAEAGTLWSAWTDGWTGAGLGGPDPVGPHAPLLAVPAWLVDHLPLLPSPASPAGFAVGLLVLFGMPFAAASAFVAFRTIIASRPVRGLAAFAWATTGVAAAGVAQGRLGALVALVLLPLVASGLWLVGTRRSTATSAFATALAGVVLGAFAPVLLAVVVALALVLALVRSRVRLHALVIAVVPVAVLAPWLVRGAEASWPVLAAGIGLAQWGGSTPEPWQLALLQTGGAGAPLAWTGIPLVAVAVLALFRGRAWGTATTSLALLAPVLLAAALVAPSVRLGTVPAGVEGAGDPITLWSGTLLLPFALVLVLSLARGVDGIRLSRAPGTGVVLLGTRWTSVTTTAAAVLVMAGGVAWAGLGTTLAPGPTPAPPCRSSRPEAPSPPGPCSSRRATVARATGSSGARRPRSCAPCRWWPTPTVASPPASAPCSVTRRPGPSSSPTPPPTCSPCGRASPPRSPAGSTPRRASSASHPVTAGRCGGSAPRARPTKGSSHRRACAW